jgi:hypothetical protein
MEERMEEQFDAEVRFEENGTAMLRFGGAAPREWIVGLPPIAALLRDGWRLVADCPDYLNPATVTAGPKWILVPPVTPL